MTRDELLLKEYELCQSSAQNLEKVIWQTSGIIGIGSIAALGLAVKTEINLWGVLLIGFFVVFGNFMWWRMARRWWSVQQVDYIRMRHIEETLGLYHMRYLPYIDNYQKDPKTAPPLRGLSFQQIWDLQKRATYLDPLLRGGKTKAHQREGIQKALQWLPWLTLGAWALWFLIPVFQFLITVLRFLIAFF